MVYRKGDVQTHRDGPCRSSRPAVCVKVHDFGPTAQAVIDRFGCTEEQAEQAIQFAYQAAQQQFWHDWTEPDESGEPEYDGKTQAVQHFGSGTTVYSEGRSDGWLVVDGLPDIETWDAVMLSKWRKFEKAILADIRYRCQTDEVMESIGSNEWWKEGAEEFNFIDGADGKTRCIADLKTEAIKAGFGPVVR